ncbi:FadR/GntR family transcriptional regulator [Fusobacterium sp. PH5-44]|uniref:FadR/GntR family transcriptional regulator n=1 Tax=unclassified Fusobacterium TaxID=2648384 RepID=UPI003D24897A
MALKKLERKNVADEIYEILKKEILEGAFKVGEKLPSEDKLSKQMGVSRASIRAAIQKLVTLGLVETRVGYGSVIKKFDYNDFLDKMFGLILTDSDIRKITEYRLGTEMAITEIAMKKAVDSDYAKLESIMLQMNQALIQNDVIEHSRLDYEFHLEICKITNNDIFISTYEVIGKILRQHTSILNEGYIKKAKSLNPFDDVHWKLIQAMKRKDLETCKNCYVEMFSVFEKIE